MSADHTTKRNLRWISLLLALAVAAAALAVLYGWWSGAADLTRSGRGRPATHPLTALGVLLLAVAVLWRWLQRFGAAEDDHLPTPRVGSWLAGVCLLVTTVHVVAWETGWFPCPDVWLFPAWSATDGPSVSRMSAPTAVMIALVASAYLYLSTHRRGNRPSIHFALVAAGALSAVTLAGHAFDAKLFYGYFTSIYTAVMIGGLSASLWLLEAGPTWANTLAASHLANATSRRLLPMLLLIPVSLTGLHFGMIGTHAIDAESTAFVLITAATLITIAYVTTFLHKITQLELEVFNKNLSLTELKSEHELTAERVRSIVETAVDAIITIDSRGRIESFNPAAERLFGYTASEAIGENVRMLMPEPYSSEHDGYLRRFHQTGQKKIIGVGREVVGLRKDGATFPVDLAVSELRGLGTIGFTGILRDVTERKKSEEKLKSLNEALRHSNDDLERFACIASHDLQEPLRKIASYCALLKEEQGDRLDDEGRDYLEVAIRSAERLSTLVKDLLAFSRLTTRGKSLQPTDADQCLKRALDNLEVAIEESGAVVTADPLPCVLADAGQLVQVFQNLIGNAIKYRGDDPPVIRVEQRDLGDRCQVSVHDNGIGIEPQYFERVFQIFQRLHNQREYSGAGIGLAFCKRIVERFGGTMSVESTPGAGSTFCFTISKAPSLAGTHHERPQPEIVCPAH